MDQTGWIKKIKKADLIEGVKETAGVAFGVMLSAAVIKLVADKNARDRFVYSVNNLSSAGKGVVRNTPYFEELPVDAFAGGKNIDLSEIRDKWAAIKGAEAEVPSEEEMEDTAEEEEEVAEKPAEEAEEAEEAEVKGEEVEVADESEDLPVEDVGTDVGTPEPEDTEAPIDFNVKDEKLIAHINKSEVDAIAKAVKNN
jgi:hypothetical protein